MSDEATINGKSIMTYAGIAFKLEKDGMIHEAEILFQKIITAMEEYSLATGDGVAPAYYAELAKIYRKNKQKELLDNILFRYLTQVKACGNSPRTLLKNYLNLHNGENHDDVIKRIVDGYNETIKKSTLPTIEFTCPNCGNTSKYLKFKALDGIHTDLVSSCCTYCLEEICNDPWIPV